VWQPRDRVCLETLPLEVVEAKHVIGWRIAGVIEREVKHQFPATVSSGKCGIRECPGITNVAEDDVDFALLPAIRRGEALHAVNHTGMSIATQTARRGRHPLVQRDAVGATAPVDKDW